MLERDETGTKFVSAATGILATWLNLETTTDQTLEYRREACCRWRRGAWSETAVAHEAGEADFQLALFCTYTSVGDDIVMEIARECH